MKCAPVLLLVLLAACDGGEVDYSAERDPLLHVPPPTRAPMEHCYGVAPAGKGHGPNGPDTSEVDFQGNAWTYVKAGTCRDVEVAGGRRGSLTPLWRDRPVGPWMDASDVEKLRERQRAEAEARNAD